MENALCSLLQLSEGKNGKWKKTGFYLKEHTTDLRKDLCYPTVVEITVHLEEKVFSILACLARN